MYGVCAVLYLFETNSVTVLGCLGKGAHLGLTDPEGHSGTPHLVQHERPRGRPPNLLYWEDHCKILFHISSSIFMRFAVLPNNKCWVH